MQSILRYLLAPVAKTGGGETGGTTSPTLTDDQIKALNDAVEGFTIPMANVTAAGDELKTIYEGAASSSNTAQTAYSNAISVALVNASVNDSTVASAITAITPATVLNALKGFIVWALIKGWVGTLA